RVGLQARARVPARAPPSPPTVMLHAFIAFTMATSPDCTAPRHAASQSASWAMWGADVRNTRFQSAPGIAARDVPRLKLKWAFALGDVANARSQPTVAG